MTQLFVSGSSRFKTVRRITLALSLVLVWTVLSGCYQHKPLYRTEHQTVAVPIFENQTFYRNVEFDLTEALIKEIETRTPYKVVDRSRADTLLTGTITMIEQRLINRRSDIGVVQQLEVQMYVNFDWKDLGTGKPIIDRKGFESVGTYFPTTPMRETPDLGLHQAASRMARDIVDAMRSDW